MNDKSLDEYGKQYGEQLPASKKETGTTIKIDLQCSNKDLISTEYLTTRIGNPPVTNLPSGCLGTYYDEVFAQLTTY